MPLLNDAIEGDADLHNLSVFGEGAADSARARPEGAPLPPATGRYVTAMIVSLALSESVGIYGLLIWVMTLEFQSLFSFIGGSPLALIYFRPRMDVWRNWRRT